MSTLELFVRIFLCQAVYTSEPNMKQPLMTLSVDEFKRKVKFVWEWDGICIVCGHEFANVACVTTDHIVPSSKGGTNAKYNKAPLHYRCNQLKGDSSLFVASRRAIEKEASMSREEFVIWVNKYVPHRRVPREAVEPLRRCGSFELPERVVGYKYECYT